MVDFRAFWLRDLLLYFNKTKYGKHGTGISYFFREIRKQSDMLFNQKLRQILQSYNPGANQEMAFPLR